MDDKQFRILELKAAICPQQARWPAPNEQVSLMGDIPKMRGVHWAKLHAVVEEARDRAANVWAAIDEIDADADLSSEGKARRRKQYAAQAIADCQKSTGLGEAKDAVQRQLDKWAKETGLEIKEPSNVGEAVMQAEVRAHLAAMKENHNRTSFLEKHVTDPRVASAVLGAPSFLSGLTDQDIGLVQKLVEQHVAPEVARARDEVLKALSDAEAGWQTAINRIGQRAGLAKGPDGSWRDPSMAPTA
jgi:hypothetical protein